MAIGDILDRLEAIESRIAVESLVYKYAQAFDNRDPEMLVKIWHEDGILEMGDMGRFEGVPAIMAAAQGFWSDIPHMHHWMSNALIDVDGDRATAVTALDCFITHNESGPTQVGGIYKDRCERRNGRWAIVERRFELHYWTPIANWIPQSGHEAKQTETV